MRLGLDAGCNYKERPDWSGWVSEVTGGRGADRIIEVGGAGTFGQSLRAARVGGMIAQIGVLSGAATSEPLALTPILHKQLHVQGIYVGSRAMFEEMNAAIAKAGLHPVIDRVFGFDQAREAFSAYAVGVALRQDCDPYGLGTGDRICRSPLVVECKKLLTDFTVRITFSLHIIRGTPGDNSQ